MSTDELLAMWYDGQGKIEWLEEDTRQKTSEMYKDLAPTRDALRAGLEGLIDEVVSLARVRKQHVDVYFAGGPDWKVHYYITSEGELKRNRIRGFARDVTEMIMDGYSDAYQNLIVARDKLK